MGGGGARVAGNFPHPLGSRARILAKQEEAAAAAGKVGVVPLPPLAWGLRIPARTWERWSHLGRRGRGRPTQSVAPAPRSLLWSAGAWARVTDVEQGSPQSVPALLALFCSLSVPLSVGQQEGHTLEMERKIHLLTQPTYLGAQVGIKSGFLSHPLPTPRWAEPEPR